jgi:hypothetical protein
MNQVNKLYVCDYENSIPPSYTFGQLFTSMEIYGVNTAGSTLISNTVIPNTNPPQILPICSNYYNYLQVYIYGTTGIPDGTMMATIDFTPFGAAYVKEEESQIPGNPYFTQQTNVYIYDVQNMIGGVSSFKIDMAQLPVNQEIEICGIYIPL